MTYKEIASGTLRGPRNDEGGDCHGSLREPRNDGVGCHCEGALAPEAIRRCERSEAISYSTSLMKKMEQGDCYEVPWISRNGWEKRYCDILM